MTFFVWYLALVWQGQLMTSLETSTNALYTPTYWLLRLTQVEKRCFRFRFCNGYLTETWISADGIVTGNTCISHVSVSADTLKRIPYTRVSVRFTFAETLTAVMFPQPVNSEDTQLSVEFPEEWVRKLSWIGLYSAAFMFPQILSVEYSLHFLNVETLLNSPV